MLMGIMVSIDWDFFTHNRAEAGEGKMTVIGHDGKPIEISVWMLYDWGHSEGHTPFLQAILWNSRYAAFKRAGINPLTEVGLKPPSPELFSHVLDTRLGRMGDATLWLSDSHAFGLQVAQQAVRSNRHTLDRIVHFDAHHDLGYSENAAEMWKERSAAECGSWLYAVLDANMARAVDVVYPDWKGKTIEKRPGRWMKGMTRRVRYFTWSEWREECKTNYNDVRATHLCRSSSWTPPWLDGNFVTLAKSLPCRNEICLDCLPGGQRIGGYQACKPREWSKDEAEKYAAANLEALKA